MFRRLSLNTFHTFKFLAGVDGTFSSQKKTIHFTVAGHCCLVTVRVTVMRVKVHDPLSFQ